MLGVGSLEGAPIPAGNSNDYRRDKDGNVIVTKLNEEMTAWHDALKEKTVITEIDLSGIDYNGPVWLAIDALPGTFALVASVEFVAYFPAILPFPLPFMGGGIFVGTKNAVPQNPLGRRLIMRREDHSSSFLSLA